MAAPMEHWEGWNSLEMNQRLRALQPDIIINNRSRLDEDFGTPEGHISPDSKKDWEACMTFNDGLSWGHVDPIQAAPYSHNAQRIIKMLCTCSENGGNLLLNIGPPPDGSVPPEAVEPLATVGKWLSVKGEAAYGKVDRFGGGWGFGSSACSFSKKGKTMYLWNWIWPYDNKIILGGINTPLVSVKLLADGRDISFTQEKYRIILNDLPENGRDPMAGITIFVLKFKDEIEIVRFASTPSLNSGRIFS
jgi:alpha-L-fucosidase